MICVTKPEANRQIIKDIRNTCHFLQNFTVSQLKDQKIDHFFIFFLTRCNKNNNNNLKKGPEVTYPIIILVLKSQKGH